MKESFTVNESVRIVKVDTFMQDIIWESIMKGSHYMVHS